MARALRVFLPLEVDFDDDDKVARLARYTKPGEARACRDLLVGMWRYCKRERTDGHVPAEIVGRLVYPDSPRIGARDADRLVEVGLCERTDDGYFFPGYLKRNKSRAQLDAEAVTKSEAGRKGGKRSGVVRAEQAETKQSGSPLLRTSEAIDRDIDKENASTSSRSPLVPVGSVARIVRAYVDAGRDARVPTPEAQQTKVSRSAAQLLAEGFSEPDITDAARNAAVGGWTDLATQLQRDAARSSPTGIRDRPSTTNDRARAALELADQLDQKPDDRRALG